MDLLEMLLGRDRKRRGEQLPGILGALSRWIVGCGCLLVAVLVAGMALLLFGVISFGDQAVTVIVVFVTIIVAIASLIRSSMGY
jgi:hypothetical protein